MFVISLVPLEGPKVNAVSPMVREEPPASAPSELPVNNAAKTVDPEKKSANINISDAIAIRLKAMRQLSENPESEEAKKQLDDVTKMVNH